MRCELRCVKGADEVDVVGSEIWLFERFVVAGISKDFIFSVDTSICDNKEDFGGLGE
jgi:hypothetical protein